MNRKSLDDLSHLSTLELFRVEVENQVAVLTAGLLECERTSPAPHQLDTLMRAAHSLKGAARIVNLQTAVRVAHAMEDCFVAARQGKLSLGQAEIDLLLRGVDYLLQFSKGTASSIAEWETAHATATREILENLESLASAGGHVLRREEAVNLNPVPLAWADDSNAVQHQDLAPDRVLRLTVENLNRLLGLAGESLVESRWLRPFSDSMQRLKRLHGDLQLSLEILRDAGAGEAGQARANSALAAARRQLAECQQFLAEKLEELDSFDRRSAHLSHRLYLEVLRARMRPFGDGVRRFPRMVRDLARTLGKQVRLEIVGEATPLDRDILERLEGPLAHLLRNAVDHGCESPAERRRAGKPAEAIVQLEARHSAGTLLVTVTDDGAGISLSRLRGEIVRRNLAHPAVVDRLHEEELLGFLLLPGFTLKDTVTEISGRGVGLDVVQNMVRGVRGSVRVSTEPGRGTRFQLQLPLTLSVLRTLLVEVGGEAYAIPLAQISRSVKLPRSRIQTLEGRHYFSLGHQQIGLVSACQVLESDDSRPHENDLPVVVLGDRHARYGLVVDRFLGERELVVQPLDPRLGKVKDVNAAALLDDGSPVLILDVEDLLESLSRQISAGLPVRVIGTDSAVSPRRHKRILAVDDSLTVRELERKLLARRGYLADVAADGVDGWNAVRTGRYDLVITDVDMPRLDGLELAARIKRDPNLKSVPVLMVSYKDREEDRARGLQAGADCYLTKGSFQEETLLQAVRNLIGEPES